MVVRSKSGQFKRVTLLTSIGKQQADTGFNGLLLPSQSQKGSQCTVLAASLNWRGVSTCSMLCTQLGLSALLGTYDGGSTDE